MDIFRTPGYPRSNSTQFLGKIMKVNTQYYLRMYSENTHCNRIFLSNYQKCSHLGGTHNSDGSHRNDYHRPIVSNYFF